MANENKNSCITDDSGLCFDNYDDFEIIFTLLDIDKINSKNDFDTVIDLLTNHSNPIREAVALKLEDYIKKYEEYFLSEFSVKKILDAIVDINPNVSRSMCNILSFSGKLSSILEDKIIDRINLLILELKNYEKIPKGVTLNPKNNVKNHAKNKKLFSMYWYLEALYYCISGNYNERIINILSYTFNFCDYTIREKSAKLMTKLKYIPDELLKKANSDQNFYVKIQVYDKINFDN